MIVIVNAGPSEASIYITAAHLLNAESIMMIWILENNIYESFS